MPSEDAGRLKYEGITPSTGQPGEACRTSDFSHNRRILLNSVADRNVVTLELQLLTSLLNKVLPH